MSVPTVAVVVTVAESNGAAISNAQITATLDTVAVYNGFVVPATVTALTNASGVATLQLWPNALGETSSRYRVTALHPTTGLRVIDVTVYVPNNACALQDIMTTPYPAVEQSEASYLAAQIAIGQVNAGVAAVESVAANLLTNSLSMAAGLIATQAIVVQHHAFN